MLLSLLFLIILAVMAYQSRKIVIPAIVFGLLKAIASCFYAMAESELAYSIIAALAGSQFVVNGLLGLGISYLVVKRSDDWKYSVATTILSAVTFITAWIDPMVVA